MSNAKDLIESVVNGNDPSKVVNTITEAGLKKVKPEYDEYSGISEPSINEAVIKVSKNTRLANFWDLFDVDAESLLQRLSPNVGKKLKKTIPGVGRVEARIGESSEGADRGGYVTWYKLLDVKGPDGKPVELEEDPGTQEILFAGRMTMLRHYSGEIRF